MRARSSERATFNTDTGLVYPIGKNAASMKLVKLLKPLEIFAIFRFSRKAFINFTLCLRQCWKTSQTNSIKWQQTS